MDVIKTDEPLEVGRVYGGSPFETITDGEGNEVSAPRFQVLAVATLEDYMAYIKERHGYGEKDILPEWIEGKRFYHVSMD